MDNQIGPDGDNASDWLYVGLPLFLVTTSNSRS